MQTATGSSASLIRAIFASSIVAGVAIACPARAAAPGAPIVLDVDATDVDHRIVTVRESIPLGPGRQALLYPRWIPGTHGPTGNVVRLAGLSIGSSAGRLPWARDDTDADRFHVTVPAGVREVTVEFRYLAPLDDGGGARVTIDHQLINLDWSALLLYPSGLALSALRVAPSVRLPPGFEYASALRGGGAEDGVVRFEDVSAETLVDSPVVAGRHHRRYDLDPPGAPRPAVLHVFADDPSQLQPTDEQIQAHRALVQQADRLFGSRHFRHYDVLLEISKELGTAGLEHHESSENVLRPGYFDDWGKGMRFRELVPHEYTHSWNGKYRRPAELAMPSLNVPIRTSMLWVYEGLTEYWGRVLAARSGLTTPEQARDQLARSAAFRASLAGRRWRSLQDTTVDPQLAALGEHVWYDMQRAWDYYDEMVLVWLDVDTLIRERSGDRRSLDDFARAFFGREDGRVAVSTYTFKDVVAALDAVEPYDWAAMLRDRLDAVGDDVHLLDGLARAGWKLDFDDKESELAKNAYQEGDDGPIHRLWSSIGMNVGKEGKLTSVRWESAAFRTGLAPGMQVIAVQGVEYKPERLDAAITAAKGAGPAVELLVKSGETYRTVALGYHDGLRYAKLVRVDGTPDRLSAILAPKD